MSFLEQIQEERRKFFQNGVLEGKEAGLSVGKREGKIETAKTMLAESMEAEFISGMTKLPDAQIVQSRDELSSTKKTNTASTDTLFLAESAYDVKKLADGVGQSILVSAGQAGCVPVGKLVSSVD